jgi:hypothetical protein
VESGEWKRFLSFAFNSQEACNTDVATTYDMDMPDDKFYNEDFITWLHCLANPEQIPERMRMVIQFKKGDNQ